MPWLPELFSAPALARLEDKRRLEELDMVPYFAGFLTGETDALIQSFAGEPEVHYPVRGRVKGERAFAAYAAATRAWLGREASIEDIGLLRTERRSIGEAVLHLGGEDGRVDLPVAIVADHRSDGWIEEVRIYYSSWPLNGRHVHRPPLLQPDPELRESDVVGEYQRALAAGDVDVIVAAFEPDGYAREPAGGRARPQRSRRPTRVLRALVLEWRRHSAGALLGDRRRAHVRAGVQRRAVGQDGGAARRPGSPSTFGVRAASSLRPASTTTRTRRSARPRSPSTPRRSGFLRRACSNHGRARGRPPPRPRAARGR